MMKHFPSGLEDYPKQGEGFADFRSRAGEPIDMSYRKRLELDATARPPLMATCSWDLAVQLVALVLSTPKEVRLGCRRLILHCRSRLSPSCSLLAFEFRDLANGCIHSRLHVSSSGPTMFCAAFRLKRKGCGQYSNFHPFNTGGRCSRSQAAFENVVTQS